jgi:hypothetical protein
MPSTFHETPIENHDLKIVERKYITIDLLGNVVINEIMISSTVD